jgi:hypothetical protein
VGGVMFVRNHTGYGPDRLPSLLSRAIDWWSIEHGRKPRSLSDWDNVSSFNDAKERTFADIVSVIRIARELAQVDEYVRLMSEAAPCPRFACLYEPNQDVFRRLMLSVD